MQSSAQEPQPANDAEVPVGTCQRCGEQLAAGQGWCLECGSARRRDARRGRDAARAATTIAVTVALLVLGAGAASYAALTDDPAAPVAAVAAPAAVAAAPAATAAAPAATTTATAPPTTTAKLPPIATTATLPPVPKSPTPSSSKTTTKTTTTKTTTTEATGPKQVELGAEAASLYDPYKRATDQTDPADSYDDDAKTAFTFSTAPGPPAMGVGIDYDLETARAIRQVEIQTTTPGFSVEVYAAEAGRPADILDPAWKHLTDVADVASKADDHGKVTIDFTPGRYRHLLLWFTTPPPAGPALAISEVRLLD